ncbi:hypothetical protein [Bradyrhizobium sp. WSM3983]|uniref:hypothetical protein n=1 Tax=Bradyrhizobium sp. WSM3983 TaxID=1038867 RepID=UPI00056250F3|nr:hypothetical protein [Bradyrhizobium sp. WSM3983]
MPISKERLTELEDSPEHAIDTSDIPEATEAFFRAAQLRRPKALNGMPLPDVRDREQKEASVQVKS